MSTIHIYRVVLSVFHSFRFGRNDFEKRIAMQIAEYLKSNLTFVIYEYGYNPYIGYDEDQIIESFTLKYMLAAPYFAQDMM